MQEAAALFHSLQVKSADFEVDEDARESKPSKIVLVYNKIDLLASTADSKHDLKKKWLDIAQVSTPLSDFLVSCTDGSGLDLFERGLSTEITDILKANESDNYGDEGVLITRERHRRHVRKCVEHLDMFLSGMLPMDLAAEEIR